MSRSLIPSRRALLAGSGAAALAAAGVVTWDWRRAAAAIEAENPPRGAFIDAEGLKVHYAAEGPEDGPPVVLLHGATGNLNDMTFRLAPMLAAEGLRVVAFDRPGLGYTQRPAGAWRPAVQARVLRAAAETLGLSRPVVLGHSWGAAVALAWGLDAPDRTRGLVCVSSASMPWKDGQGSLFTPLVTSRPAAVVGARLLRAYAGEDDGASAAARIFRPQPAPDGYLQHLQGELLLRPASFQANTEDIQRLDPALTEQSARYPDLNLPVAILHGEADPITPPRLHARKLSRTLPDARLQVLPGIGHMLHHVAPEAVVASVLRIVSSS